MVRFPFDPQNPGLGTPPLLQIDCDKGHQEIGSHRCLPLPTLYETSQRVLFTDLGTRGRWVVELFPVGEPSAWRLEDVPVCPSFNSSRPRPHHRALPSKHPHPSTFNPQPCFSRLNFNTQSLHGPQVNTVTSASWSMWMRPGRSSPHALRAALRCFETFPSTRHRVLSFLPPPPMAYRWQQPHGSSSISPRPIPCTTRSTVPPMRRWLSTPPIQISRTLEHVRPSARKPWTAQQGPT